MKLQKRTLLTGSVALLFYLPACKKSPDPVPQPVVEVREMTAQEKALAGNWKLTETRDTSWGYANGLLISMDVDSAKNFNESHFLRLAAENAKEEILKKYPGSLHCVNAIDGSDAQTGWTADQYNNLFIDGQKLTVMSKTDQQLLLRFEVYNLSNGNGHKIFFYYLFNI